ncbi:MAG: hypothetical protein ACXVDD_26780 [Polyangia bacterium]
MIWDGDTLNAALWQHLDKPGIPIADRALAAEIQTREDQVRAIVMVGVYEKGADGEAWAREQIRELLPWVDERNLALMWGRFSYDCQR